MDNIEKLFKLIKENPDLDVLPMVAYEVCGDEYSRYMGSIGSSYIDLFRTGDQIINDLEIGREEGGRHYINEESLYFKSSDEDRIKDELYDFYENKNPQMDRKEIIKKVEEDFNKIQWEKVIVLNIDLPQW